MRLSVTFENTQDTPTGRGPVQVGWFLNETKGGIIYDAPERVRSVEVNRERRDSTHRIYGVNQYGPATGRSLIVLYKHATGEREVAIGPRRDHQASIWLDIKEHMPMRSLREVWLKS